ncbi:hypothetical protein MPER_01230 [Moniliophthora perniciosa FA553]|nr:hypothetical protein MPER_01230 [Moniliophthora perniciosa FA553]
MQSRASISLLSFLLLLFTQLASALPNPAARELEAHDGWGHDDDNKWSHDDDEWEHYEHSAWDVLLQAQIDISVEIDAIKSYQQLTYDDCSKHVTIIRRHIRRIYETIHVKYQANVNWDDIFDRHDHEEIRAQIVIIIQCHYGPVSILLQLWE